jgi:hypothetical protein
MRTFILLVLGLLAGLAAGIFADRHPVSRPVISDIWPGANAPLVALPAGATTLPAQALGEHALQACFSRNRDYADTPPGWMQRQPMGPKNATQQPARTPPKISDHPGLVKLEQILSPAGTQRHHCAATRIAPHWFLTAAHCVRFRGTSASVYDMLIIAPQVDTAAEDAVIVPVEGAVCHHAWYDETNKFDDDIALLYVDDPSPLGDVPIARLDGADGFTLAPDAFDRLHFAGWGKNGDNRFLQGGPLELMALGETLVLARQVDGFGPCVGDSGGPLYATRGVHPPVVAGVLSSVTNDACPPYDRAFYVRLKSFAEWISGAMATCVQKGRFVCRPPAPAAPRDQPSSR